MADTYNGDGNRTVARGSNTDSGSSWTAGFGSETTWATGSDYSRSSALVALASGNAFVIGDNQASSTTYTQLQSSLWNGTSWGTAANVFGSSLVPGQDHNAWGIAKPSNADIHAVSLSDNSSTYLHARFNGTSWSAGDTIPTLAYGTLSGVALASDGTSVWAFVFDTSKNLQYSKWVSGTGWSAWTILESARTNAPAYLTACYNGSNTIGLAWTENTGSNYDIIGTTLSTAPVASFTVAPATIPAIHSGNITLTFTGTNSTWTSGSTVTVQNSVTGTTTVTKGTWTRTSNTAATLTVTTGAGAGTYTIAVDGVVSPALTVATATLSMFGTYGGTSLTEPITLTGTNTL